jgi:3',5'-cyclic AMP phosphodiesterase CpdA
MIIAADIHLGHTSPAQLEALVRACRQDRQRLLVVAGDLTQRGTEQQYQEAEALLRRVMHDGVRVVCCPGNHDLSRLFGYAPSTSARRRDRYLAHITGLLGAQQEVLGFTRYDTVLAAGQDVVVSLRSVHRRGRLLWGHRVRAPQILWARQVLDRYGAARERQRIHFVTHYSMWNLPGDRHRNLHRRARLERGLLLPLGVTSYINGHNHRFEAAHRLSPRTGHRLYHVQAPSLSRTPLRDSSGYVCWDPASGEGARLVSLGSDDTAGG